MSLLTDSVQSYGSLFLQLHAYDPQCPSQVLNRNCYDVLLISRAISSSPFLSKHCAFKQLCCLTVEGPALQPRVKQAALLPR